MQKNVRRVIEFHRAAIDEGQVIILRKGFCIFVVYSCVESQSVVEPRRIFVPEFVFDLIRGVVEQHQGILIVVCILPGLVAEVVPAGNESIKPLFPVMLVNHPDGIAPLVIFGQVSQDIFLLIGFVGCQVQRVDVV